MNNSNNSPNTIIIRHDSLSDNKVAATLPLPILPKAVPEAKVHLISGGIAGLVSAITLQPLDLLKTRLQQQHKIENKYVRTTITEELKKLTQLKDLWRGALPSTLRTSIGAGLYFTTLSHLRSSLATYKSKTIATSSSSTSILPKLSPLENLSIGFIARATVGLITMPVTVVKTRYESNIYNYRSILDSIVGIYKNDDLTNKGSFKNFFKGSIATLARDCPYAGLYVLFYESFKNELLPRFIPANDTTNKNGAQIINSSAAVLAASLSTTITAPFDAIKTRLQLSDVRNGQQQKSILQITKVLVNEEGGISNLFRGLSLRLGRKAISAGISWCIYEELIKSSIFSTKKFS
ncbi:putative mitochondrial transport protein [Scheffersomyces coipomensis]|uniref:putative mitochondrial transport protein n=1 Tax=Scheffersomyces coipomensis TaxID=1788519 RepID=UPI00315D8C8B